MTEISHVKGSDNVVTDTLSRYPKETGQICDHLLLDEHDMDLVCHFFNLSSELSMYDFGSLAQDETVPHVDVSLKGNGADLLDSSTTQRAYSENVLEDLTLPLDPVSKLCMDGYDLSLVSADVESRTFIEAYPKCSSKSSLRHFHSIPGMFRCSSSSVSGFFFSEWCVALFEKGSIEPSLSEV
jgi:hypothetical protein